MSSYQKKCCVQGCDDIRSSRHRIPIKNTEILNIWLDRIANPELKSYDKRRLYNIFVCSSHFIKECTAGKYLVRSSLPTLKLPGFTDAPTITNSFWYALKHSTEEIQASNGYHTEDWIFDYGSIFDFGKKCFI